MMEYLSGLVELWTSGLHLFYRLDTHLILLVGVCLGLLFGALPGITASTAIALCIPFTFTFTPYQAIPFLVAIYVATCLGGAITAILINIPGAPSSVCTAFDGYPMARRGEAGRALGIAALSSGLGGLIGLIFLMLASPAIVTVARKFGTWEYALLAIMGLTMISYIAPASMLKALIGGVLGLLLATVGQDSVIGFPRFTMGRTDLLGGINFVVILLGLFGMAEVFMQIEEVKTFSLQTILQTKTIGGVRKAFTDVLSNIGCLVRSSIIATFIGALPAAGPTIAATVSYGVAKRASRNPEEFGKGCPTGVVASEAADNACVGGALIPTLTLGIPGCPMTAVILGAFMIHGLTPGPRLFTDKPEFISSVYIGYIIALVWMLVIGLLGAKILAKLLLIPHYMFLPMIMLLTMVGAYSLSNSLFDVLLVVMFGVAGYFLRKVGIPPAPIVLGVVLGPMLETNLSRSLILAHGSLLPYVTRPMSLGILGVIFLIVLLSVVQARRARTAKNGQGGGC